MGCASSAEDGLPTRVAQPFTVVNIDAPVERARSRGRRRRGHRQRADGPPSETRSDAAPAAATSEAEAAAVDPATSLEASGTRRAEHARPVNPLAMPPSQPLPLAAAPALGVSTDADARSYATTVGNAANVHALPSTQAMGLGSSGVSPSAPPTPLQAPYTGNIAATATASATAVTDGGFVPYRKRRPSSMAPSQGPHTPHARPSVVRHSSVPSEGVGRSPRARLSARTLASLSTSQLLPPASAPEDPGRSMSTVLGWAERCERPDSAEDLSPLGDDGDWAGDGDGDRNSIQRPA